jgi:hypothetical protein
MYMIDPKTETLITLREAASNPLLMKFRAGQIAHVSTLWRYALKGARAADGRRVKLETLKTFRGLSTSAEAIARFVAALNPQLVEDHPRDANGSRRSRRRRVHDADRRAEAALA